jgi:hypothetical protein
MQNKQDVLLLIQEHGKRIMSLIDQLTTETEKEYFKDKQENNNLLLYHEGLTVELSKILLSQLLTITVWTQNAETGKGLLSSVIKDFTEATNDLQVLTDKVLATVFPPVDKSKLN